MAGHVNVRRLGALERLEKQHGKGLANLGAPPERKRERKTHTERYQELIKESYAALKSRVRISSVDDEERQAAISRAKR